MELEEICQVAVEEFVARIAVAKVRPQFHEQFRAKYELSVVTHVTSSCYGVEGMTPEKVQKCVQKQWPLKQIRELLHGLAKAAVPKPSAPVSTERRMGMRYPSLARRTNGTYGATSFG